MIIVREIRKKNFGYTLKVFEYHIISMLKAFYPNKKIVFLYSSDEPKITEESEIKVILNINIIFDVSLKVQIQDNTAFSFEEVVPMDMFYQKAVQNQVKWCIVKGLGQYTGKTMPWGILTGVRPTKMAMKLSEEGYSEEEIKQQLITNYHVREDKVDLCVEVVKKEQELLKPIEYLNGYSLYVGIPFCPTRCLYCSFSSYPVSGWEQYVEPYLQTLLHEIRQVMPFGKHNKLQTIYIGGGTPTVLSAEQLELLLSELNQHLNKHNLLEYTVEAGRPDTITREKLKVLKKYGVSRISINPQTMNNDTLERIGRRHNVGQVVNGFHMAREEGFTNINMDVILGLPGESIDDMLGTFHEIKKLNPDSITVHMLSVKKGSYLKEIEGTSILHSRQQLSDRLALDLQYKIRKIAQDMNMSPYYLYRQKKMTGNLENIGYARTGATGLYNILIMEEKHSILAVGAGGITKIVEKEGIRRIENVKDVLHYIKRIDEMIGRKLMNEKGESIQ